MKTSIIQGTLSKEDSFQRHELPRFEQSIKGFLVQSASNIERMRAYLKEGSTISLGSEQHTFTPDDIKELAPDQHAEATLVLEAMDRAMQEIGYVSGATVTPTAEVGASVEITTSKEGDKPAIKTARITPSK